MKKSNLRYRVWGLLAFALLNWAGLAFLDAQLTHQIRSLLTFFVFFAAFLVVFQKCEACGLHWYIKEYPEPAIEKPSILQRLWPHQDPPEFNMPKTCPKCGILRR
ncbi:MAG: hypothetical protein IID51_07470 [Proteobacteria bacterium]|nr:hypothetical protein [Pseudomonadota bacterium]